MNKTELAQLHQLYRSELMDNVVPFWVEHSPDTQYGGFFSCLARDGQVYDTDKFAWMQGRMVWMFSKLHNVYGTDPKWLPLAQQGVAFMRDHAYAPDGDVYFSMDRTGRPLMQPYNLFSECFWVTGLAEYYRATGDDWAKAESLRLYRRVQVRKANPKGIWTKPVPGGRALCAMNLVMVQFMMYREMQGIVPQAELDAILAENIHLFFARHVDRERKMVFERALPDGGRLLENMEGRLMTPGHALEALWFLMDIAQGRGDKVMVEDLAEIMLWVIEFGWDSELGGIPLYKDALGLPGEKLEANQRHWWVHAEALCAFLLAYKLTGNPAHFAWFKRIHDYTFGHFPDPGYGEWFTYLDRHGLPEMTVKGSKWKALYHLPRALAECEGWLKQMLDA